MSPEPPSDAPMSQITMRDRCPERGLIAPLARRLAALAGVLITLGVPSTTMGAAPARIEAIQVGFGATQPGWVKLAAWTPVRVDLQVDEAPFQGQIELVVLDDDGTPSVVRLPVSRTEAGPATVVGYVRPGMLGGHVEASLLDGKKRRLGRIVSIVPSESLSWSTQIVLSSGNTPGLEDLLRLPKFAGSSVDERGLRIGPLTEILDAVRGLDAVDVIVLATDQASDLDILRRGKSTQVLRAWVEQGGHLVVSLGREWQAAAALLGDLLPATPTADLRLTDVGPVENFAGNVTRPLRAGVTVARLAPAEGRQPAVLAATAVTPLVVRAAHGFGRVTLTGVNVSVPPFSEWADRRYFWDKLLGLQGHSSDTTANYSGTRGALIQSASSDLAARMHQSQQTFPHVTLIPFGLVASLVAVYLLLIGPIDYLFLRRVARRMELTWITFPLIVVATSLLAYAVAHSFKGNTLMANKLDLLDVDQPGGAFRGASWMTLYSPGNHDYSVALRPAAPDLEARPAAPTTEVDTSLSWFAPPDTGLSGLGRMALGNRRYDYERLPDEARLSGLRIPIWSSKSLSGQWSGRSPGVRLFEADLRVVAGDRLAGVVRNMLSIPIRNAQLYYGKHVYELGNMRPGGIARVDSQRTEATARVLGSLIQSAETALADRAAEGDTAAAGARKPEVDFLRGALFHDALGTRADDYPSLPLRRIDLTSQVAELRRPILVAEVDAPAAFLTVEGGPGDPAMSQSTVLRVILPMDPTPSPAVPVREVSRERPSEVPPRGR
jgi:hypothetical protein